jgi:hypothetical protein
MTLAAPDAFVKIGGLHIVLGLGPNIEALFLFTVGVVMFFKQVSERTLVPRVF